MSSEKGRMFSHLQWKDRLRIEKMLKEKKSKTEIARTLRVDYTTIMQEIKRGLTVQRDTNLIDREVYCAETAERKYQENLRAKGPDIKLGNDHKLANYIEGKIADDGYSPEAALLKIKEDGLTFSVTLSKWTVYKYINDGVFLRITNKSLPMGRRRKTEYKKVQAARVPKRESIENRPVEVATREEPFRWEMDSVLPAKEGGSKKRFLTITERTSRADLMFLMPDGTMASVVAVLDMLEKKLGSFNFRRIFQTITVDNGSEFQDWEGMTRAVTGEGARTHIYYCHPYSAFERGSNENGNRMIRRRVPKGTDFTEITEEDTLQVQRWVNEYPRGILGGRCAGRVLLELAQGAGIEGAELLL
ncbi:IS30 family transposase [uncultured Oscillibacter sp.]|uniref:IS30 family transposase n=1 Tax=uncultured Oscillibacter sp. TaxID=876091 RepID=UPI002621510F|nr:IS30 family transposase [uncultured Oscillibacter sp.]